MFRSNRGNSRAINRDRFNLSTRLFTIGGTSYTCASTQIAKAVKASLIALGQTSINTKCLTSYLSNQMTGPTQAECNATQLYLSLMKLNQLNINIDCYQSYVVAQMGEDGTVP